MPFDPFARALTDILINQAPEFVGVFDGTLGWFTQVNPAGARLLGYASVSAFLAEPARALRMTALSSADWALLLNHAQRSGRQEVETEITRPDGDIFQARIELTYFAV